MIVPIADFYQYTSMNDVSQRKAVPDKPNSNKEWSTQSKADDKSSRPISVTGRRISGS